MNSGWAQWMGLIIIPLVVAVGQILFKVTAVSNAGQGFLGLLGNATFWTAIILYGVATVVWIPMIESVPISRAYLFMALTYVYVPLFATLFLQEAVSLRSVLGTVLIIVGILISVSR